MLTPPGASGAATPKTPSRSSSPPRPGVRADQALLPPGQPYAISDQQRKLLLTAIKGGNTFGAACQMVGVRPETFYRWLRLGGDPFSESANRVDPEEAVEPYRSFTLQVRMAEAEAEEKAVAALAVAFERDWRAAAWWLSHRRRKEWGDETAQLNVSGGTVQFFLPSNGRGDAPELPPPVEAEFAIVESSDGA